MPAFSIEPKHRYNKTKEMGEKKPGKVVNKICRETEMRWHMRRWWAEARRVFQQNLDGGQNQLCREWGLCVVASPGLWNSSPDDHWGPQLNKVAAVVSHLCWNPWCTEGDTTADSTHLSLKMLLFYPPWHVQERGSSYGNYPSIPMSPSCSQRNLLLVIGAGQPEFTICLFIYLSL